MDNDCLRITIGCFFILLLYTIVSAQVTEKTSTELKNKLTPIDFDTSLTGTLKLDVFPSTAEVFVNGAKTGTGSQLLDSMRSGVYNLLIKSGKYEKKEFVIVQPNRVNKREYYLGRKLKFYLDIAFEQHWAHYIKCYGGSYGLGLTYLKNSFGLYLDRSLMSDLTHTGFSGMYGLSIQWLHESFEIRKYVTAHLGGAAGIWMSTSEVYNPDSRVSYDVYDDCLYGGARVNIQFGHEYVLFNVDNTLLISYLLKVGLKFVI